MTRPSPADTEHFLFVRHHARLAIGVAVGIACGVAVHLAGTGVRLAFILGFDAGALATLVALYVWFHDATLEKMKRNAVSLDAGSVAVNLFVLVAAMVALVVVATEIPHVTREVTVENALHASLVVLTIVLSWVFIQTIHALHYAHDYYVDVELPSRGQAARPSARMHFPGDAMPTYSDFLYFSFTIGMTFAVSDVEIRDARIRRLVLMHAVTAFFFTTGVLALAINLVGGLAGK